MCLYPRHICTTEGSSPVFPRPLSDLPDGKKRWRSKGGVRHMKHTEMIMSWHLVSGAHKCAGCGYGPRAHEWVEGGNCGDYFLHN